MPNTLRHAAPSGHAGPGQRFCAQYVYLAAPESVRAGRRAVRDTLTAWGLDPFAEVADQVADELLANAVRQAGGTWPAEVLLRLTRSRCFVIIQVGDHSPDAPPRPQKVDGLAEHGRGLFIARMLSDQLAWYEQGGWKLVWAAIRIDKLVRPAGRGHLERAA